MLTRLTSSPIWQKLWPVRDLVTVVGLVTLNIFFYGHFEDFNSQNTFSAPLVPILIRVSELGLGWEYQLAASRVLLILLLSGIVAWYVFFRYLSTSGWWAGLSALLASLPLGWWGRTRVEAAYLWGDGAHLAALSLSPVVCWALLVFLRKGAFSRGVIAAVTLALVALTSPFGLMTTLIFSLIVIFSEMLQGQARLKAARAGFVVIASLGLTSFWYHPKFFYEILASRSGQDLFRTLGNLFPLSFFVLPILATFGFLLFERRRHLQPLFVGIFFTLIFFWVSFASGLATEGLSRPSRYLPELGFSLALLLPIALVKLRNYLIKLEWITQRLNKRARKLASWGVTFGVIILLVWLTIRGVGQVWEMADQGMVLGWWSQAERTGIWELRGVTGVWNWVGYILSAITAILLVGMGVRTRLNNLNRHEVA
jgi:hypothetical protein